MRRRVLAEGLVRLVPLVSCVAERCESRHCLAYSVWQSSPPFVI